MKCWISSGWEYPREKAIYVVREGGNPPPCIYNRIELSVLLNALRLDGWISFREADRILELVDSDEVSLEYLACAWGEPFETLCAYFYSKTPKLDRLSENNTLDFWIVPEFQLTSYISVLLKRGKYPTALGDVDLLNEEQLRFLLRFLRCDDWMCSRSLDFRLLNYTDFVVVSSKANLDLFLRHHAGIRRALEKEKRDYMALRIRNGEFLPDRDFKIETVKFGSGPIPRRSRLNRFEVVFREAGETVKALLDELLKNMPMTFNVFFSTLSETFEPSDRMEILNKLFKIRLLELQAGSVVLTVKGLDWLAGEEKAKEQEQV